MTVRQFHTLSVEITQGNIVTQPDLGAIVNAANAWLRTGGGVAGAIHRAAGPGLEAECLPLGPIGPGEAVITGGHHLPNAHVIHCLGPVYGKDQPAEKWLAACYRNALRLADQAEVSAVGFPAIATGVFGYPLDEAAQVAVAAVARQARCLNHVKRVRFVLFSEADRAMFEQALAQCPAP